MKKPPEWLGWTVAGSSLLAIVDMPYGYYQLLRLVVTGYCAYLAFVYFREQRAPWVWSFGFLALVYNPIFVITMSKEVHGLVNLVTAGLAIYESRRLRSLEGSRDKRVLADEIPKEDIRLPEAIGSGSAKSELIERTLSRILPDREQVDRRLGNSSLAIVNIIAAFLIGGFVVYAILGSKIVALGTTSDSRSDAAFEEPTMPVYRPPMTVPDVLYSPAADTSARTEVEAIAPPLPSFLRFSVEESDDVFPLEIPKDSWFWNFRTRISDASKAAPNFGSNAVVATWGCGTGCKSGVLADHSTGSVHEIPVGGEVQQQLAVQTRRGSNLLLANWNETGGPTPECVFEAFVWTGSAFKAVAGFPKKMPGVCPMQGDL